jgi:hypothetical protein
MKLTTVSFLALVVSACHPAPVSSPAHDVGDAATDPPPSSTAVVDEFTSAFGAVLDIASHCATETCQNVIMLAGSLQHQLEAAGKVADLLDKEPISDPKLKTAVDRLVRALRDLDRTVYSRTVRD